MKPLTDNPKNAAAKLPPDDQHCGNCYHQIQDDPLDEYCELDRGPAIVGDWCKEWESK